MGSLDGRVAIVTGAGRGIGAGVAKLLAREGAQVVVNDLGVDLDGTGVGNSAAANEVVEEITGNGGTAVANGEDIGEVAGGERLIRSAIDQYGKLDILVNVAGILRDRMIFNMTEDEWDAVIRVHLKGHFNTIKPASVYWREQRNPEAHNRIINFTSGAGLHGSPGQPNYSAAKQGIVGLTYSCANSLARYGVTSNAIAPAAATRMTRSIPEDRTSMNLENDELAPENVAPIVAYLASERSDWCNGWVLGASGYQVILYGQYEPIRQLVGTKRWEWDELQPLVEKYIKPAVEAEPPNPLRR